MEKTKITLVARKLFLIMVVLIFIITYLSAYTNINIYIDKTGEALFLGETTENLTNLPKGIEIRDGKILGRTYNLTSKQGGIWSFAYSLKNAELNVILPESAIIKSIENGEIYINNEGINIYFINQANFTYYFNDTPSNNFFKYLIGFLIFLGGIIFFWWKKLKKGKSKSNDLELIKKMLNEREKIIVENLKKYGKIKNSYLRKLCNIPKASFSRHITQLERKKIIKKTGQGKNKFIELIE